MGTATLIKTLPKRPNNPQDDKALYRLEPPLEEYGFGKSKPQAHEYVVVSGVNVMWSADAAWDGLETYIFPADSDGNILDWAEMPGSFKGEINHEKALEYAGYTITKGHP